MSTNKQRREAAQRKLARQLERRSDRAKRARLLAIGGATIGAVALLVGGVGIYAIVSDGSSDTTASSETPPPEQGYDPSKYSPIESPPPPATRAQSLGDSVNCVYTPTPQPAAKQVNPPQTEAVNAVGTQSVSLATSQGPIGLTLDRALSPCTVNSFTSLVSQGFYNATTCHRLTTSNSLRVLQCGDPSATGKGGPGYQYDNEFPTDQLGPNDPAGQMPIKYERGVVAMANAGAGTNGSQFFLVYGDSALPPQYTIFGRIDEPGVATLEKIADGGAKGAMDPMAGDGAPNLAVKISEAKLN